MIFAWTFYQARTPTRLSIHFTGKISPGIHKNRFGEFIITNLGPGSITWFRGSVEAPNDPDLWLSQTAYSNIPNGTFLNANVDGCVIDRFVLESLKDYGGLTRGDRMRMKIIDSVAALRAAYSGFVQWLHLTSVAFFLFPYMWFLFQNWAEAHWYRGPAFNGIALWEALLRYIWNGGLAGGMAV